MKTTNRNRNETAGLAQKSASLVAPRTQQRLRRNSVQFSYVWTRTSSQVQQSNASAISQGTPKLGNTPTRMRLRVATAGQSRSAHLLVCQRKTPRQPSLYRIRVCEFQCFPTLHCPRPHECAGTNAPEQTQRAWASTVATTHMHFPTKNGRALEGHPAWPRTSTPLPFTTTTPANQQELLYSSIALHRLLA